MKHIANKFDLNTVS